MSIAINLRHKVDLQTPQQVRHIGTLINQNDSGAHHVVLELTDGGDPAQLDGYTVIGAFARADGNVVMLGGTIDGSTVDVELTSACYAVPGPCMLSIKLTGEEMRTVYKAAGSVDTETDGDIVNDEEYTAFDEMVGKIVQEYLQANPMPENDPTVPEWAKQPEPPKYTKADVGLSNVQNVKQYSASNPPPYPVTSVNGETGDVVIEVSAEEVGLGNVENVRQYSASNPPPYPVTSVNGMTGDVIIQATGGDGGITIETDPTVPAWAKEANPPTYSKTDVGLGNVDNVKQYSASNPPPYPVRSVNGMTGDVEVEVSAEAVGLENVDNVRQYSASNPPPYPVTSVNGKTGAVTVSADGGNAASLGGVAASVYQDFMARKTLTVSANSSFVKSGSITAERKGGVLKVGGYLQTKVAQAGDGYETHIICTINGVKVNGNQYAAIIDHATGKAYNILLMASGNNSVVQLESAAYQLPASTWLNFGIVGIIA